LRRNLAENALEAVVCSQMSKSVRLEMQGLRRNLAEVWELTQGWGRFSFTTQSWGPIRTQSWGRFSFSAKKDRSRELSRSVPNGTKLEPSPITQLSSPLAPGGGTFLVVQMGRQGSCTPGCPDPGLGELAGFYSGIPWVGWVVGVCGGCG